MKKENILLSSFLQAAGVFVYVALVSVIMNYGDKIFSSTGRFFGPIAFLLLFVSSAAITGSLVLGKPVMMYLDGTKKEAIKMVGTTIGWLFVITLTVFLITALKNII